jgi:predicted  nucleic acid-binding Zn-ribbon protein
MSATTHGPYSTNADLETTADYPPASPAAPADTWVIPPRAKDGAADDPMRAYHEEIRTLRQSVAGITLVRDQLQADLSALTAKRHELEELLLTRDALLSKHERELGARQDELGTLRASLAAATAGRDSLQAELTALSTKLRELEPPSAQSETQRLEYEQALAARDQRVAELTAELSAGAQQQFLLAAERDDLHARLERARSDLSSIAQRRERQTSAQAEAERAHARREAQLARSHDDLTELQRRVARHREALQRGEARRQVFEVMLREREDLLDERDARLLSLQDELDHQRSDHRAALERANSQLAAAIAPVGGTPRPFVQPIPGTAAPAAELPAAELVSPPVDAQAQQRIVALEAELAEVQGGVDTLKDQLQAVQGANETLRSELAAAELQLQEAGSDLRHSNTRVTQLEAEVAAAAPPLPAGERLLVRTVGDTGIVHVLGRRTTIGRVPSNDLCVDTELVSRHHAVVLVTDSGTVVEDLNSTNGVFINDVRVMRQELREGDVVTIGATSFRYVLKRDAHPA